MKIGQTVYLKPNEMGNASRKNLNRKENNSIIKFEIMQWIGIIIGLIILFSLVLAFVGMWNSNTDKLTDYDLYGMDAEEYLKKKVSEEYYNKHYKQ